MSESIDRSASGAFSRRNALKAGVAVGVGAAAWSGAAITSLGGTPAYASTVGCTGIVNIDLSAGCRNTDQESGCDFGYHPLKDTGLPSGYSITNNVAEGTCCNAGGQPVLHFPSGITCAVHVLFASPPDCTGKAQGSLDYGPSSSGTLNIPLTCVTPAFPSSTQYTIVAKCGTTGGPPQCLQ